jgi:hypothetical protein
MEKLTSVARKNIIIMSKKKKYLPMSTGSAMSKTMKMLSASEGMVFVI